jgi:hypothetical protein
MNQVVSNISQRFINFISRIFIPQSVFFVFFFIFDFIFQGFEYSKVFLNHFVLHWKADIFILLIVGVGFGFIIAFLNQFLDRFNNDNLFPSKINDDSSEKYFNPELLKQNVINKLKNKFKIFSGIADKNIKDRDLYEILGNDNVFPTIGSDIVAFNDKANHAYTIAIALMINIVFFVSLSSYSLLLKIIIILISSTVLSIGAVYIARSHYKERNIRLYINYLLEEDTIQEDMRSSK